MSLILSLPTRIWEVTTRKTDAFVLPAEASVVDGVDCRLLIVIGTHAVHNSIIIIGAVVATIIATIDAAVAPLIEIPTGTPPPAPAVTS